MIKVQVWIAFKESSQCVRKDEISVIGFCERVNVSVKMGGIGSVILMKMEKKKWI